MMICKRLFLITLLVAGSVSPVDPINKEKLALMLDVMIQRNKPVFPQNSDEQMTDEQLLEQTREKRKKRPQEKKIKQLKKMLGLQTNIPQINEPTITAEDKQLLEQTREKRKPKKKTKAQVEPSTDAIQETNEQFDEEQKIQQLQAAKIEFDEEQKKILEKQVMEAQIKFKEKLEEEERNEEQKK